MLKQLKLKINQLKQSTKKRNFYTPLVKTAERDPEAPMYNPSEYSLKSII